jgi:hypothetical protein
VGGCAVPEPKDGALVYDAVSVTPMSEPLCSGDGKLLFAPGSRFWLWRRQVTDAFNNEAIRGMHADHI